MGSADNCYKTAVGLEPHVPNLLDVAPMGPKALL